MSFRTNVRDLFLRNKISPYGRNDIGIYVEQGAIENQKFTRIQRN